VRIPSRSGRSRLAASVTTLIAAATVIGLALAAPSAFQNGSFETSTIGGGGSVLSLATGSTQITGWTVAQGSVDLFGGLSKGRRIGKGFGNALTFDFAQETKLCMPGAIGLRTVARGLATTARDRRYGTGTKVAQSEKLLHKFAA